MSWYKKKRSNKIDPNELLKKAEHSLATTEDQQPRVNFLTTWLRGRKDSNGFGDDFEWSLIPKENKPNLEPKGAQ